jgi:uncharacterized protein (DUF2336 family)
MIAKRSPHSCLISDALRKRGHLAMFLLLDGDKEQFLNKSVKLRRTQ